VEFEFDDAKSQANLLKHGIDFIEAQEMWARRSPDRDPGTHARRDAVARHRNDR